MALITSRYTMDKQDSTIRRYLADARRSGRRDPASEYGVQGERGHGSHDRYPVPAKARARARRRAARTVAGPGHHRYAGRRHVAVNEYFARHPEMMLGQMRLEGDDVPGPRADARGRAVARAPDAGRGSAAAGHLGDRDTAPDRARPPPESIDSGRRPTATDVKDGAYARARRRCWSIRAGRGIRDGEGAGDRGVAHPRHAGVCATPSASSSARSSTMRPRRASSGRGSG